MLILKTQDAQLSRADFDKVSGAQMNTCNISQPYLPAIVDKIIDLLVDNDDTHPCITASYAILNCAL